LKKIKKSKNQRRNAPLPFLNFYSLFLPGATRSYLV
jgi:hypothetical protein